jgi:stearoyl-CoA desaturase (Delta-9 desaturase)
MQSASRRYSPSAVEVPGVISLDRTQARLQRFVILLLTIGPFIGLVAAVVLLWGRGLSGLDLALFLGLYILSGIGVTVGFHRLLTHGSFEASRHARVVFAVLGSLAIEGSVISWVADHRRHHAFADKEGDPHSPHLTEGEGVGAILRGLWHAHVGWFFSEEKTERSRWAPDLLKDSALRKVDRAFPVLVLVSLFVPPLIGFAVTRSWIGALSAFVWGSLVRMFLLHHVTWSVNSICHFFGKRPFETTDESTNNWVLSLISFGESWHNNHHAFPTSAIHGIGRFQLDPSGGLIKILARFGVAKNLRLPNEKQLSVKKA